MRFAIKVVWADGSEEYVKQGSRTAVFPSRERAKDQADFMRVGMEGDPDVQSISVVRAPTKPDTPPGPASSAWAETTSDNSNVTERNP